MSGYAQSFSGAQKGEIEKIIREYLIANPEVLQEAIAALEKKQAADEAEKHQAAVKDNEQAIFNSPRQVNIGNPQGDVTFVEFFDYNCGYCKRALADLKTLMKADPKLRVVLKDFPVLGPESIEASRVALAVKQQIKGDKLFEYHTKLLETRGRVNGEREAGCEGRSTSARVAPGTLARAVDTAVGAGATEAGNRAQRRWGAREGVSDRIARLGFTCCAPFTSVPARAIADRSV